LTIALCLFISGAISSTISEQEISSLWDSWKIQNNRFYSGQEEAFRLTIFADNLEKIAKFNEENDTPKLGLNKFADLTPEEFKNQHASCANYESKQNKLDQDVEEPEFIGALPDSVDWRAKGAVTPVKDQGQCGSCWAFSTTGVIEGYHFIQAGKLLSFSEQQIVDCDKDQNEGCNGGLPYLAIEYVAKQGLEEEADYPYTAKDGSCKYDKNKATQVVGGYKAVTPKSTDRLKEAVVSMPVSVGIEADQNVFQLYKSGVIKLNCGANLDHAVLVVGYHKVGTLEAFIVKNSWGSDWGESGYVQIWSNNQANGGKGVCGILAEPVIPTGK